MIHPSTPGLTTEDRIVFTDGGTPNADSGERTVLIVDDDETFARSVALWLDDYWETIVATDGRAAVSKYSPHVDAVLLDRRLSGKSGSEVLAEIREQDGDARIAMVTGLEPDLDIVEMNFDMYLEKPVDRDELVDTVRELFERAEYARELQALFSLSEKLAKLRTQHSDSKLESDERFQRLREEFERVHRQAQSSIAALDMDDWAEMMQMVDEADA